MTPDAFMAAAKRKGMLEPDVTATQIADWLRSEYGLGNGHAGAIYEIIKDAQASERSVDDKIDEHFTGAKAHWRQSYDKIAEKSEAFGADGMTVVPAADYLGLTRKGKKFAIVIATSEQMDVGIKLKGVEPEGRLEESGTWNALVTHRVRITDPSDVDAELIGWLKRAYAAA
ncbi:MAG: DUF4287 domain-containing protein [Thermoleophilaceae bacterium]|nr:DUF4287 domain-containing protein [Thermoleophilaceae bacterium]